MASIFKSTAVSEVLLDLETTWIPSFRCADTIRGGSDFPVLQFKEYLSEIGTSFDLVPWSSSKNAIE